MRQHHARLYLNSQPRYALPAYNLLHSTASIMLGLQSGMPLCCGVWGGGGGVYRQDVMKPLPVYHACTKCRYCSKQNKKSIILCSNLSAEKVLGVFLPRDQELLLRSGEVWEIDLHAPKCLRERECSLEATLAADAIEVYLKILQTRLCTSLLISYSSSPAGLSAI